MANPLKALKTPINPFSSNMLSSPPGAPSSVIYFILAAPFGTILCSSRLFAVCPGYRNAKAS